jgi:hypothetical protein
MSIINVRGKEPYYSQRNNKFTENGIEYASRSCNVTSMIMALDYCGYAFPSDLLFAQPEDALLHFILDSTEVDIAYAKLFPEEHSKYIASGRNPKTTYPPEELHVLLSLGTNLWMGKEANEITKFRFDLSIDEVVFELAQGRPVVQSGVFGKLHHVTTVVGVDTEQDLTLISDHTEIDLSQITSFILEDPYGNYHTSYQDQNGKDIVMPYSDYVSIFNIITSKIKWGHLFVHS